MKSIAADVDQDGAADQVDIFTAQFSDDTALMWVDVTFANGGYTSGIAAQAQSIVHFPGFMEVEVARLQYFPHDGPLEIALTVAQGASHSRWSVLAFDPDHCEFVQTTIGGESFGYGIGASAIASSAGCTFGAHGELTFSTSFQDFNSGQWSVEQFELRGTEWNLIDELSNEADPALELPNIGSPTDCFGA